MGGFRILQLSLMAVEVSKGTMPSMSNAREGDMTGETSSNAGSRPRTWCPVLVFVLVESRDGRENAPGAGRRDGAVMTSPRGLRRR